MITVLPEKDKSVIGEYYNKAGLTASENSYAVTARSGDEVIGYCIFDIKEKIVTLLDLEPKDDLLMADGVIRSALHVASNAFVFEAHYIGDELENILEKLNFIKDKAICSVNIDKLFGGCCCGEKK